jgi:hypothetical protein
VTNSTDSELSISSAEQEKRVTKMTEIISDNVKQGCMECLGETTRCRYCGTMLNRLYGIPREYGTGELHRRKERRAY